MLREEEKKEILHEIAAFPNKKAACIEALKTLQKFRRWISDETIQDLAKILEMNAHEIDAVATFYNLIFRQPVGRHVILVCDSISCWVMGYNAVADQLAQRLGIKMGETTKDDRFTLLPIPCLGVCDHAPACMIDNDLHVDLTPGKLAEILERYS
jgi:NADH-quinone oxidoreductase subunit E